MAWAAKVSRYFTNPDGNAPDPECVNRIFGNLQRESDYNDDIDPPRVFELLLCLNRNGIRLPKDLTRSFFKRFAAGHHVPASLHPSLLGEEDSRRIVHVPGLCGPLSFFAINDPSAGRERTCVFATHDRTTPGRQTISMVLYPLTGPYYTDLNLPMVREGWNLMIANRAEDVNQDWIDSLGWRDTVGLVWPDTARTAPDIVNTTLPMLGDFFKGWTGCRKWDQGANTKYVTSPNFGDVWNLDERTARDELVPHPFVPHRRKGPCVIL